MYTGLHCHCTASPPWAVSTPHQHLNNILVEIFLANWQPGPCQHMCGVWTLDKINKYNPIKIKEVPPCHCAVCRRLYRLSDSGPERGQAKLPLSYSSVLTCQTDVSQTACHNICNKYYSSVSTTTHRYSIGNQSVLQLHSSNDEFVSSCNILLLFSGNLSPEIY